MNFKRYHVSKNLFDKDTATIYTLYAGNGDIIRTSSNARSIAISCTGGEIYTVSKKAGQRFMVCFTTEPIASQVPYTNLVTDNTATSITAEAPEGAKYLFVYFYNSTADTDTIETLLNSIMINTGSTALPYEPYSSEVWHDIPYYQHKTATDTLTLPAVIYPNDTSITVGIKGNTTQSGAPTPDNPITPQGTGERTGNLFDEDYPIISETIRYIPLYVGEGSFTLSTTTPYDSSVANLFLLSGNVSTGASTAKNGAWKNHNVTAQSVDGYVTIAYRHYTGTTSPVDCQTMLNTGSTALPYEPYGYFIEIEVS